MRILSCVALALCIMATIYNSVDYAILCAVVAVYCEVYQQREGKV